MNYINIIITFNKKILYNKNKFTYLTIKIKKQIKNITKYKKNFKI